MSVKIKTTKQVVPKCYAYTTPTVADNAGWVKIGYTEQDDVETRINQQLQTAHVKHITEWSDVAVFSDGITYFTDNDFHAYLVKMGVERMKPFPGDKKSPEWFKTSGDESYSLYCKFRKDKGIIKAVGVSVPYTLREEQERAVSMAYDYFKNHKKGEFLWNAKPRFGKTLAAYDLCKRMAVESLPKAINVLIVTNRPAIVSSWYSDYVRFLGEESGFYFVSETDSLQNKPYVLKRCELIDSLKDTDYTKVKGIIEFLSLQDLKGSIHFGGTFPKLKDIKDCDWDLLIIDEAHEGVDTYKTDIAFEKINRKATLHLSGTPFKALANDKFAQDAIFNWTYADEQKAKRDWGDPSAKNPYETLPQLNLFTYKMSDIVRDRLSQGLELDGETVDFAFDLNEFFSVNDKGVFNHEKNVDRFLDALTTQEKFPFSTEKLRLELRHTFWLLNRVDSVKALAKKLEVHPIFGNGNYKIVIAAGNDRDTEDNARKKSFDKVRDAIENNEKTITLSVGQLTTGITIPEWTAVLMLSNISSPSLYMQSAFRAQNPYLFHFGTECLRKERAYVFDFDPARTLQVFEKFANDLSSSTSGNKGDRDERKNNVRELLNFFPVIGEDENGEMTELDAEQVLVIPRKIYSQEVVRRGFMCDFLFQNISNIFRAPQEVVDIITSLTPFEEPKNKKEPINTDGINVGEDGTVEVDDEYVIGTAKELFGDKIYTQAATDIGEIFDSRQSEEDNYNPPQKTAEEIKSKLHEDVIEQMVEQTKAAIDPQMKKNDVKRLKNDLQKGINRAIDQQTAQLDIKQKELEQERKEAIESRHTTGRTAEEIHKEFDNRQQEALASYRNTVIDTVTQFVEKAQEETVKAVETKKEERKKESIQDKVRDHLRGFSRTIPSFLMAYGDENTTLANFDTIIPPDVFLEVTSITIENFRLLRDGADYIDENGETQHYFGNHFDPVVFDDSVREFIGKKKKLANYFDETQSEDIFDYIPPQKTNQIYTPKRIVKQMVDMLEEENPGCFDDPTKTFADLYMKSGLYIAEIVKRLYNSEGLKKTYPDNTERLKHIFEKQVYGLAPTQIIYQIAVHFILGFADNICELKHNFRQVDALPYAKDGTLESKLDEIFN